MVVGGFSLQTAYLTYPYVCLINCKISWIKRIWEPVPRKRTGFTKPLKARKVVLRWIAISISYRNHCTQSGNFILALIRHFTHCKTIRGTDCVYKGNCAAVVSDAEASSSATNSPPPLWDKNKKLLKPLRFAMKCSHNFPAKLCSLPPRESSQPRSWVQPTPAWFCG